VGFIPGCPAGDAGQPWVSRNTNSRITLYTGNTYFKHPNLHWPGTFRPFSDYAGHVDILLLYTLNLETRGRAEDLELIVQEPWRIGSKERSSTTREYIGAVTEIERLREGRGTSRPRMRSTGTGAASPSDSAQGYKRP
jgi:hypothetical protein